MDFDEMQDRVEALVKLGGWSNTSPQPDFAFLVNEGLRILTRQTCHLVEDFTLDLIRDQAEYDIDDADDPRQWIAFNDDAIYNSTGFIRQSTRDLIRTQNRLWRSVAAGTPWCWYWAGQHSIGVYPKPSASGATIGFQGPRHEAVLTLDADTPALDADFHEGICLYGAWFHGKLYARGQERDVVAGYLAEGDAYVEKVKNAMSSQEAGFVQRTVSRPPQEYANTGRLSVPIYWPQ